MSVKMTMAEFVGLKPCPFCGGEAKIAHSENGWQLKQIHDDSCWLSDATTVKAVIGEWDETKAIAAWNSRAERTCKPIIEPWDDSTKYDAYCGNCNYSLGDGELEPWNYCPYCGCKVVSE